MPRANTRIHWLLIAPSLGKKQWHTNFGRLALDARSTLAKLERRKRNNQLPVLWYARKYRPQWSPFLSSTVGALLRDLRWSVISQSQLRLAENSSGKRSNPEFDFADQLAQNYDSKCQNEVPPSRWDNAIPKWAPWDFQAPQIPSVSWPASTGDLPEIPRSVAAGAAGANAGLRAAVASCVASRRWGRNKGATNEKAPSPSWRLLKMTHTKESSSDHRKSKRSGQQCADDWRILKDILPGSNCVARSARFVKLVQSCKGQIMLRSKLPAWGIAIDSIPRHTGPRSLKIHRNITK